MSATRLESAGRGLVIVQAGLRSRHAQWRGQGARPAWDLVVCQDSAASPRHPESDGVICLSTDGPRWPMLARLLADTQEAWQTYTHVWLPTDDLDVDPAALSHLFDTAARLQLDLALPAFDGRQVAAGAPLFSTRFLGQAVQDFALPDDEARVQAWTRRAAQAGGRISIVDRPVVALQASAAAAVSSAQAPTVMPRAIDREPPAISVIVPTFNRAPILQRCLAHLQAQTLPADRFEVIVVDDGSSDDTPQVLARAAREQGVLHLQQPNLGPAAARNRALAQARGRWVLFLNDDALLDPAALAVHVEEHARRNDKAAVLGSFYMHPDSMRLDRPLGHCLDRSDLAFDYPLMVPDQAYGHAHFYTCNLSIDREFVLSHGGFDEGFVRMGAEDIEIGRRLELDGCRVYYRPDCKALHAHRLDPAGLGRMFQFRGRGGVHFFAQHLDLTPDYAAMTDRDCERWLALHARLEPMLARLDAAIARNDAREFVVTGARVPLDKHAAGLNFDTLWRWPDSEVERMVQIFVERVERELALAPAGQPTALEPAAARLYPVMQFIKWYHDTLGVVSSSELPDYLRRKAAHGHLQATHRVAA